VAAPRARPRRAKGPSIATLANLGPKSAAALQAAGIKSLARLRTLGAVASYAHAKRHDPRVSLNLLWAIEGALTGLPWQVVAREHRASLLLALEEFENRRR
jgi:DNA transformation protein and related proteins